MQVLPLLSLPHNLCPVSQAIVTRLAQDFFDSFRSRCYWLLRDSSAGTRVQLPATLHPGPRPVGAFLYTGQTGWFHVLLLAPAGGQIPE